MRGFVIITDSGSDLPSEIIKKYDIKVAEISCTFDGKEVKDDLVDNVSMSHFYECIEKGDMPRTSMVNTLEFVTVFENCLKDNKDIIYISLSSGLSGTYNSALIAKESLLKKYKDAHIEIVDSLSATMGEGLLVYHACQLKTEGKSYEEIVNWLNDNAPKVNIWFMVEDLNHLKRGGRISGTQATVGNLLNIKPILTFNKEGKIYVYAKERGRKKSLKTLIEHIEQKCRDIENKTIGIVHANCEKDAKEIEREIKKLSPREILIAPLRIVVGTHAGPLAIGVIFIGDERY